MIHNYPKIQKKGVNDYLLRYNFSNNLLDEKGVHNLTGVNTQLFVNDKNNNPLSAYSSSTNANYAYANMPTSPVAAGSFTLSFFAYINTTFPDIENKYGYIGQWNTGGSLGTNIFIYYEYLNNHGFAIEPTTGIQEVLSTNYISNNWFLFTGVYNSVTNTIKIYLNGILNNSLTVTGTLLNVANRRFYVNNLHNNSNFPPNMATNERYRFDDIRLYKFPLTDAQITELYNS